jgi:hypothetical protein
MKKILSIIKIKGFVCLLFVLGAIPVLSQTWSTVNGPTGGSVRKIEADANGKVYALTAGNAVYASTNGGSSWTKITTAINSIHGFALDGSTIYIMEWSNVYASTDGGVNWVRKNATSMNYLDIGLIRIPATNTLFAYGTAGAWISVDAGINWKKIFNKITYSAQYSTTGDIYFTSPEVGVLKHALPTSPSTLSSWDASKVQVIKSKLVSGNDGTISVGVNRNNSNKVFISYQNAGSTALIYETSTNGGLNWTAYAGPGSGAPGTSWHTFSGKIFHIQHGTVYEVIDGTTPTFSVKGTVGFSYYYLNTIWYSNFNEIYAGVEGDGVWKSTDNGGTFSPANGSAPNAIMNIPGRDIEYINGKLILIPHSDSKGYWVSSDNGGIWTWQALSFTIPAWYPRKIFRRLQDNSIIIDSSDGTQRTTDGVSWTKISTERFNDYVNVGATEVWGFRGQGTVQKSVNNAVTWTSVGTITGFPNDHDNVLVAAYDGVNFYLAMHRNGQVQYWKINATTLAANQMNTGLSSGEYSNRGLFVYKGKLYIGDGQRVAISNDQGVTYKYIDYIHESVFPINQNNGGIGISKYGILATTKDDGVNISSSATPSASMVINQIVAPNGGSGDTYAATYGGPVLKFNRADSLIRNSSSQFIDFGWTKLQGPMGGGRARRIYKSSTDQLFTEDWSAIHRFNSGTNSWETLESMLQASHGMFHDGTNIYQIRWGELFKSTNGGNTFNLISTGQFTESTSNGNGLFKHAATGHIYVLSNNGLYRSTNDGVTFNKVATSGRNYLDLAESGSTLVAISSNGTGMVIERSVDNGVTWISAQTSPSEFQSTIKYERILSGGSSNVFTITTLTGVHKSTDGGLNWTSIKSDLPTNINLDNRSKIFVSPTGVFYLSVIGYPGKLYLSSNQGASWTLKHAGTNNSPLKDVTDIIWIGTRMYITVGYSNGVLYSDDDGTTFNIFNNNAGFNGFKNFNGGPLRIKNSTISISDGSISSSLDQGNTWTVRETDAQGIIDLPNGDLIAFNSGVFRSTDGGANWSAVGTYNWVPYLVTGDGTAFTMYGQIGSCCNGSFNTSADLINWTPYPVVGLPSGYNMNSMAAAGDKVYVLIWDHSTQRNALYSISFGVATLLNIDQNPQQVVARNGKAYLMSTDGFVYESSDGNNWTKRAIPGNTNRLIFANNGYLFVSGVRGLLWVSRDGGISWQNVSATNVAGQFGDIAIDANTGIAYGTMPSRPLFKSSGIVIPNDKAGPTIGSLTPANQSIDIGLTGLQLTIGFNESPKPVAGKKLKIFSTASPTTPLESIDVSTGVASENFIRFTPSITLTDVTTYYVIIDPGAFTDFYGNATAGILTSNEWRFTTVDATKPAITFITSNLDKGVSKSFEITVADNKKLDQNKLDIYYRGITSQANESFQKSALTVSANATDVSLKATVAAAENWYDGMGLEFYFEVVDAAGNKSRSPSDANVFHYSYINFPLGNEPKVNGIGYGGEATSYKIIAIPHQMTDAQISSQFSELGSPKKTSWRMFTYSGDNKYDETGGGLTALTRGKGYWINSKNLIDVFLEGASTPQYNRNSFFKLELKSGWNQIGNPYPVSISWTETVAGATGINALKKYSAGTYSNATTLGPFEGGFVFVTSPQTLTVRFPGITSGGRTQTQASSELSEPAWELPLLIEQGDIKNEISGIGMNPKALEEFDDWDDLNMPLFEGLAYAEMNFPKASGQIKSLSKDVVPTQDEYVWNFALRTSGESTVELRWDNTGFGNNDKELFLLDEGSQRLVDMRERSSYTLNPSQAKSFKIFFGQDLKNKIKPTMLHVGTPYPNPLNTGNSFSLPLSIDDSNTGSNTQIILFSVDGQRIELSNLQNLNVGFHTIENVLPDAITPGIYLLKTIVQSPRGIETKVSKIIIR